MRDLKYIINKNNEFLIFPRTINHCDAAINFGKIVGAGFCMFGIGASDTLGEEVKINCFGESLSLHIKSRPEDTKIIQRSIALNY